MAWRHGTARPAIRRATARASASTHVKLELLDRHSFDSLLQAQQAFDRWQHIYNHERPHDALGLPVPADRYRPSRHRFILIVEPFDYSTQAMLRRVDVIGRFGSAN